MPPINRSGLVAKLTATVNTAYETGSYVVDDVLATALSMSTLGEINIITVANVNSLPNLKYYNSPNGMVYYVNDIDVFAVSSNLKWLTLDGRLLREDGVYGVIWSWGTNAFAVLGDGTTVSKSSPVSVVGSGWRQISAGLEHNLAICSNGTAWAWGSGFLGQLGDGTVVTKSSPVSVVGGFTDWCQVSAGCDHSLGVRTGGTAWAWGANTFGQLGDNTVAAKCSPVSIISGVTGWCQVSAGRGFSIGIRSNGQAQGWGNAGGASGGSLGDGTTVNKSSPSTVVGGFSDWCHVSAGYGHSLGVRVGRIWSWGSNSYGQLGDNTTVAKCSPVSVVGGFNNWCRASAGGGTSIGLLLTGEAWAWGNGCCGRLGAGTGPSVSRSSPVSVVGGFTDWCQVSSGRFHSLGVRSNGTAWAWGLGTCGRLGNGTTVNTSSPVSVAGGFTSWCQVSAGCNHSLGIVGAPI
jgi:alpha-tubulin suppressor-like RCC1 family protein